VPVSNFHAIPRQLKCHSHFSKLNDDIWIIDILADIIVILDPHFPSLGCCMAIEEAMPEIQDIFSAIKRIGFSGRLPEPEIAWKEAALKRFDDSKKGYESIKREFLEDDDIYRFTGGQEKRDFEAKLLLKIIRDRDLGNYGEQKLREFYRDYVKKPTVFD
jgi:hypothetical protein